MGTKENAEKKIKKVSEKLPWWLSILLTALPIAQLADPTILTAILGHYGLPAALIALIVAKVTDMFSDSVAEE